MQSRRKRTRVSFDFEMNFCVKRLISEVESRPVIWDSRTKEYSDRSLKREAWEDLCASLVPTYYESSIGERNGIVATMQRKWKSVRDAFLRELKKSTVVKVGPGGLKYTKPYAYYDNLLFLKPVCETRPRKEDDDVSNSNEVMIEYENNEDSDNDPIINAVHSANETKAYTLQPTPKRKLSEEKEEVFGLLAEHIRNKRRRDNHEDPDRQFLLSLLPDLQSMDDNIKFDLKYEIMSVIKRFKDENVKYIINTSYSQT